MPSPRLSDRWITRLTAAAVLCVAGVAAVVSYEHAYALVRQYGEQGWTARLVPLTVDGLILSSSMVMLHCARQQIPVPGLARWLLGVGITATLAANATHGLAHGAIGALIAAWPAVALVGCYELLMLIIRYTTHPTDTALVDGFAIQSPDRSTSTAQQHPAPSPALSPAPGPAPGPAREAEPVAEPGPVSERDPLRTRARDAFAPEVTDGRLPSIRTIRNRLRVGQPKAQELQAYLAALSEGERDADSTKTTTKGADE